jgi:hypothetical protein
MNTDNLIKLLDNGDENAISAWFQEFLAQPLSPEERGQAIMAITVAYMEMQNSLGEAKIALLTDLLVRLKKVSAIEKRANEMIDMAHARQELNSN